MTGKLGQSGRTPLQGRGAGSTPMRSIRVPDEDWHAWQAAAAAAGLSVSEWIRRTLNADLIRS
jgi:hypothetical protein